MKKLFAILMALAMLLAIGCSSKSESMTAEMPAAEPAAAAPAYDMAAQEKGMAPGGVFGGESQSTANRGNADLYGGHKIIATYNLEMSTDAFDEHYALLTAKAEELGGYVQDSSVSGTKPVTYNDYGRNANLTFRIPSDKAETFMEFAGGTGTITHTSKSTQDVTLDYYDSETRLDVLKTQLERLKSILVTTDNLADIVELEKAIAEVTIEIEQMTTQLRRYDDLIDYTTVYLYMREERLIAGPAATQSVGERIGKGFTSNLSGVGVFLENFFVWFVSSLPVLVLLALAGWGIVAIIRRAVRRRGKTEKPPKARKSQPSTWVNPEQKQEDTNENENK
ncbi:MAG: DUF4349 domain-containing protein [Candidatus Pelethousia sp.]|nr:DUF4349 domain-containing protein [Candidatus Pelethousia sp.]